MSYSSQNRTPAQARADLLKLSLGALGVVYGDIGTSPLYAFKECFAPAHGIAPTPDNILGVLSLIFWSLTVVVSVKYLIFILRADNHGEGGIMALIALLSNRNKKGRILMIGLFGAALLYGDGVITPAISVLSALEGLGIAAPQFDPWIVPGTIGILVTIFLSQRGGTARIGNIFGAAILVWFVTIGFLGIAPITQHPEVLTAVSPHYALEFFWNNRITGFLALSAVVLCVTGGEALYADMGHFGRAPIRRSWFAVVMPCLLLNYFGQGANALANPASLSNPFYALAPAWFLYPLVGIATVATVIASQALISGAFSLTQQAVQLGYFPRLLIHHTSSSKEGQIYVPGVNWTLMFATVTLVLLFRESSQLAAAYGIAVTGTMTITSLLFYRIATQDWRWPLWKARLIVGGFLFVDFAFFASNSLKIAAGGWIPIVLAMVVFTLMSSWKRGRQALSQSLRSMAMPLEQFVGQIAHQKPHRVPGTAVFMTLNRDIAPPVLLHHYRHNRVLHRHVVLLSIVTEHEPEVASDEHVRVTDLSENFVKVIARYGYMQTPDITEILTLCEGAGLRLGGEELSFYLGRETLLCTGASGMQGWRKRLFVLLSRNARSATDFFGIPPDRVIEIGSQIQI